MRDSQIYKWKNKCTQCTSVVYLEPEIRIFHQSLKKKRIRTSYTTKQLEGLEEAFVKCEYITKEERLILSNKLDIGERNILIWFQNRRMKKKRKSFDNFENCSEIKYNTSPLEIVPEITLSKLDCFTQDQYELPFPYQHYEQGLAQTHAWDAESSNNMYQSHNFYAQPSEIQYEAPTDQHIWPQFPQPTPYFANFFESKSYEWMYDTL